MCCSLLQTHGRFAEAMANAFVKLPFRRGKGDRKYWDAVFLRGIVGVL